MAVIPVALAGRSYEVRVARNLLALLGEESAPFLRKQLVPVVADANARVHWGAVVERALAAAGKQASWYGVEPGEGSKSWDSLARLTDWLLAQGVERGDRNQSEQRLHGEREGRGVPQLRRRPSAAGLDSGSGAARRPRR